MNVVKAIHSDEEHRDALEEVDRLWDDASVEAQDKLEVLAILIEEYERKHHALPSPDPVAALLSIMEWRGLTPKDLERYIGSRSHVSEVLNGKRELSKEMIRSLSAGLGIPSKILLGPPRKALPQATALKTAPSVKVIDLEVDLEAARRIQALTNASKGKKKKPINALRGQTVLKPKDHTCIGKAKAGGKAAPAKAEVSRNVVKSRPKKSRPK